MGQPFPKQRRKFPGIAGILGIGPLPITIKTPPAFQLGSRRSRIPRRGGELHALPPLPVGNACGQARDLPSCIVLPRRAKKDSPAVRGCGDCKICQRKKPEGAASQVTAAEDGLAVFAVQNEKSRPPLADCGQEPQAREDAAPASRQSCGQALLHAHKEQEETETQEGRAKKAAEALPASAGRTAEHKESAPFTHAGPRKPERGPLRRIWG